jgi:hypothetical protein
VNSCIRISVSAYLVLEFVNLHSKCEVASAPSGYEQTPHKTYLLQDFSGELNSFVANNKLEIVGIPYVWILYVNTRLA